MNLTLALYLFIGYLIGSIPFSQIIAHRRKGIDLRTTGYKNVGALNVMHNVGLKWGLLAGILDAGKGLTSILLTKWLGATHPVYLLASLAAILGHNYPIWLGFKGGKGLAVAIGITMWLVPMETLIGLIVGSLIYRWKKLVVLAAPISVAIVLILTLLWQHFWEIQGILIGELMLMGLTYVPRIARWIWHILWKTKLI